MGFGKKLLLGILKLIPVEEIIRYIGKVLTQQNDKVINFVFQKVMELDQKSGLSGFEKRKIAYEEIKKEFNHLADWVINLLIEIAVAYYKYKHSK